MINYESVRQSCINLASWGVTSLSWQDRPTAPHSKTYAGRLRPSFSKPTRFPCKTSNSICIEFVPGSVLTSSNSRFDQALNYLNLIRTYQPSNILNILNYGQSLWTAATKHVTIKTLCSSYSRLRSVNLVQQPLTNDHSPLLTIISLIIKPHQESPTIVIQWSLAHHPVQYSWLLSPVFISSNS